MEYCPVLPCIQRGCHWRIAPSHRGAKYPVGTQLSRISQRHFAAGYDSARQWPAESFHYPVPWVMSQPSHTERPIFETSALRNGPARTSWNAIFFWGEFHDVRAFYLPRINPLAAWWDPGAASDLDPAPGWGTAPVEKSPVPVAPGKVPDPVRYPGARAAPVETMDRGRARDPVAARVTGHAPAAWWYLHPAP